MVELILDHKINPMDTTILDELKKNKTKPCVSVIIPTHKSSFERTLDKLEVDHALEKVKEMVFFKYGKKDGLEVVEKLYNLSKDVDYIHNDKGIGFFVSPEVSYIVKFPFLVKEKIVVGNTFEIRDILYLTKTAINYYTLMINEKEVKLFEGHGDALRCVKDNNFPYRIFDDYEYTHTSLGSSNGYSLKSMEKDKSIVKEQRLIAHLKHIDQKISKYLESGYPLIISGSAKELGYFNKISINSKKVAGKITGNYTHENMHTLGLLCFEQIKIYLQEEETNYLKRLDDAVGKNLAVSGVRNVWKAAKEGKGLILLVEKDFEMPGFVTKDDSKLFISPPLEKHEILTDAVDDVMEIVMEKKGKVVIVENGKLEDFGKIALILRYY